MMWITIVCTILSLFSFFMGQMNRHLEKLEKEVAHVREMVETLALRQARK